jgi:hypothetical protein
MEYEIDVLKAFAVATATVLAELRERLDRLEVRAGVDYESNL